MRRETATPTGHSERLAARARRGDRLARATLVEEHMGLVRALARRYRGLGLPVEDLVQEGAIGLICAVEDYDPGRGASFSTYAFWRVKAAVTHAVTARAAIVRVPRPVLERRRQVAAARTALAAAGREPDVGELAAATSLSRETVAEALAAPAVTSLDLPVETLADDPRLQPEAIAVATVQRRTLRKAVRRLRPRKQTIVRRHFGLDGSPEPLSTIAADLHLSPERTRALKDEALRDLAEELTAAP